MQLLMGRPLAMQPLRMQWLLVGRWPRGGSAVVFWPATHRPALDILCLPAPRLLASLQDYADFALIVALLFVSVAWVGRSGRGGRSRRSAALPAHAPAGAVFVPPAAAACGALPL